MMTAAGILLVTVGIAGAGFLYSASMKEELQRMEGLLRLARMIRSRIECFRQPLSAIYADFADEALKGTVFLDTLRSEGFEQALAKGKDSLGLRPALLDLLYEFGRELGRSGAEEQVRHCDRCIGRMEEALAALRAEYPVRARLSRTLSLCFAAMAALLLL